MAAAPHFAFIFTDARVNLSSMDFNALMVRLQKSAADNPGVILLIVVVVIAVAFVAVIIVDAAFRKKKQRKHEQHRGK